MCFCSFKGGGSSMYLHGEMGDNHYIHEVLNTCVCVCV